MKTLSSFLFGITLLGFCFPAQALDVAAGKAKYDQMCVACHGASGKGDGVAASALNPKPRNLADQAYMSKRTDADLTKVIKSGGAAAGLSASMAPFGGTLSDTDITNIVAYIRTMK